MTPTIAKLRPGDLVEVRTPDELFRTLDAEGTLGQLPFMPEMVEFCGKRFLVSKRAFKTCYYGTHAGIRKFRTDDVVLLEGLRCSGAEHDGCQKACMIFWREAWLRRVEDSVAASRVDPEDRERLRARLKTKVGPTTYFCQASEILKATGEMSRWDRLAQCIREVRVGNCSALDMAQRLGRWLFWRTRRLLLGEYARGSCKTTPVQSVNLQPGEWVEVRPMEAINATLNRAGYNRGLNFPPDLRLLCGQHQRVERRIEKIIVDGTGEMRQLRNTVYLDGSHCGCIYALGGCPRGEFSYWREIWLQRVPSERRREQPVTSQEKPVFIA
jgi:hypothetical protein